MTEVPGEDEEAGTTNLVDRKEFSENISKRRRRRRRKGKRWRMRRWYRRMRS